ncbi:MAG TPA: RagB/SusD family nutrient uptake outer membrane protein, partial [Puia sp.]
MKKQYKLIGVLLFFTLGFLACKRQLDLQPLGELTDETFYQTEADFDAASLSPYATLLDFYWDQTGSPWYVPNLYPDDDVTVNSNQSNDVEDFNWLPSNGNFLTVWQTCYKGIQRANVVLAQLPRAKGFQDESAKPRYEAEARFMRAYFNFILATYWGTPPIADSSITSIE